MPEGDLETFAREFVDILEACISLGSYDQLGVLLGQWRNTAYVWSRPELVRELRSDHADEDFDAGARPRDGVSARGARVPAPPTGGQWDLRFAIKRAARNSEQLKRRDRGAGFTVEECRRFPFSPSPLVPTMPHSLGVAR